MKKLFITLICCCLAFGAYDAMAQSKTTKSTSKTSSSKKKKKNEKPQPIEVDLRYNSNDCLFPMDIEADIAFGPTKAPNGAGQVMEIQASKKYPYLFEYEHNTVWYKFTVPYNGFLEITITPTNPKDDYDFLVYKYTDVYFSNHVIQNKVLPLAGVVNTIDTTSKTGVIGMKMPDSTTANTPFVTKTQMTSFVKSVFVKKGEIYYICVDNATNNGSGHTIKASLHVDSYEPIVMFYDAKTRKSIDVDFLVIEKNTDNRAIVKNDKFRKGVVKFVPHFNYTMYAKKDGYFSIYKDFNADIYKGDTLLRFLMQRIERGTKYPISDIYFDNDESELLPESDTALMNYVAMFRNHPNVSFLIKGYVQTYGFDVDGDVQMSLQRAISVKEFFVKNGLPADKISVAGMTQTEVKREAAAILTKDKRNATKVEIIITEIER